GTFVGVCSTTFQEANVYGDESLSGQVVLTKSAPDDIEGTFTMTGASVSSGAGGRSGANTYVGAFVVTSTQPRSRVRAPPRHRHRAPRARLGRAGAPMSAPRPAQRRAPARGRAARPGAATRAGAERGTGRDQRPDIAARDDRPRPAGAPARGPVRCGTGSE